MAQEEHTLSSSPCRGSAGASGGGGGGDGVSSYYRPKKIKPKKAPQRGLGVAELERIRLEEANSGSASRQSESPLLPLSAGTEKSHQFQQLSSSVVNASSGFSLSPVLSSQMELPSNQILRGSNHASPWLEDDKIVGLKRSYPFSLEIPPALSFPASYHPTYAASLSTTSDELPSCSSGYTAQMEPRHKYIRDGPSNSNLLPDQNPSEAIRNDERLNGDFLTLAPPSAASPPLNSHQKHSLDYSQENLKRQVHQVRPSGSGEQPFSFFPVNSQVDRISHHVKNGNGGKGETIDLNLKL